MRTYHDLEWGVPLRDPHRLFELLCLEGAQAGLAWITILRKREAYRAAFADFSVQRMARFDDADRERLLADAGIVRNRSKVDAFIGNARAWLALPDPVSLIWSFVDDATVHNRWIAAAEVPAMTERSRALSSELRARGFRFVGPTIAYALMQSAGLVNDHVLGCFRHAELAAGREGEPTRVGCGRIARMNRPRTPVADR